MRTPVATSNGRYPHAAHGQPWCRARRPSYSSTCPTSLASRCEGWPWPWRTTRRHRASTSGRAGDMVPPHGTVVCAKKNGTPCRTVDFQALNLHATRETHHTQSPFHQARTVPNNKKKTVFDCWNGYHSVPLHEDDYHLTTFITPWGRKPNQLTPTRPYSALHHGWHTLRRTPLESWSHDIDNRWCQLHHHPCLP